MQSIKTKKVAWIDVTKPAAEDVQFLKKYFDLHLTVLKEYLKRNKQTKIEKYKNYLFIILYFPIFDRQARTTRPAEIDFIITRDTLITSHFAEIPPFQNLIQNFQMSPALKTKYCRSNAHLFFNLIKIILDACQPMLDHIQENIDRLDEQIFQKKEEELLKEIAVVKRDINDFRLVIGPQQSILKIITSPLPHFFRYFPAVLAQEAMGAYQRVWQRLKIYKQMIEAIEQTNNNLLSFKMEQKMGLVTIISALFLPLFLITSIFNCYSLSRLAFISMLALLAITGLAVFIFFFILRRQHKL